MAQMPFLHPRRWFQFRLSTWFVLVAILGWAMASAGTRWTDRNEITQGNWLPPPTGWIVKGPDPQDPLFRVYQSPDWHFNPRLHLPACALAAFLAGKLATSILPREWLPFTPSTSFVLTAILGWAIASWPYVISEQMALKSRMTATGWSDPVAEPAKFDSWYYRHFARITRASGGTVLMSRMSLRMCVVHYLNPLLVYPAIALVAFLTWQIARAIERTLWPISQTTAGSASASRRS